MDHDEAMGALTRKAVDAGIRVFEMHKYGRNDVEHVDQLLRWLHPMDGASILDVGCGIGEVARLMHASRPDLRITLLNNSPAQLAMCPPEFPQVCADMADTGLPDESFDAVMVLYTLGFGELERAIPEFERVLKPGGVLFIVDIVGRSERALTVLGYTVHPQTRWLEPWFEPDLRRTRFHLPQVGRVDDFLTLAAMDGPEIVDACRQIVAETKPCVATITKQVPLGYLR